MLGGKGIDGCGDDQACSNGILFDVVSDGLEFFMAGDLSLVETLRPDVEFVFEAKGKASFDVLHGFFEEISCEGVRTACRWSGMMTKAWS